MSGDTERRGVRLPRHQVLTVVIVAAIALLLGWIVWGRVSADRELLVAQDNAAAIAEEVRAACARDGVTARRLGDLCDRAQQVAAEPAVPIPGPRGEPGRDGRDGRPGRDGQDGQDGRDGRAGTDGQDGADGAAGADGAPGADGRRGERGERGPAGEPGPQCPDGSDAQPATVWVVDPDDPGAPLAGEAMDVWICPRANDEADDG